MPDPVTIDNLGPEAHNAYAQNAKFYTENSGFVKPASQVSSMVVQDTLGPILSEELNKLLGLNNRPKSFSRYKQPENYNTKRKRYRDGRLIPTLGSDARQYDLLERIRERKQSIEDAAVQSPEEMHEEIDKAKASNNLMSFLVEKGNPNLKEIEGRIREFTAG